MRPTGTLRHPRAPLLWLVLPFAGGIAAGQAGVAAGPAWLVVALAGLLLMGASHRIHSRVWQMGLLITLSATGVIHYTSHRQRLPDWQHLPDREIEFTIRVDRVFGAAHDSGRFNFLGHLRGVAAPANELTGQRVHVQLRRPTDPTAVLARGATLRLIGRISVLPAESSHRFTQYLEDSGLNFRVQQARWLATVSPPSPYATRRDALKQRAGEVLSAGLSEHPELTGALRAMLLGERHVLANDAKTLFMRSGTMHLFAISGLHIGVIAATLLGVLRLSQIPPVLRFVLGAGLLWAYVDLIGQTPSALRAWLMITCWHAARVWRAPGNPLAAIATSALLVLLLDPMQLFSAGFQMSYAIVFALLIHGLPLGEHWQGLIRPWRDLPVASLSPGQRMLQAVVAKVLVAAAFTWTASLIGLITSVAYFNWFTPLAFYANIVLVPLAGGVVAAGFAAIILGVSGLGPLALLFNHAAALLLVIMQGCLNLGLGNTGSVPATFFISVWGPLGIMAVLVSMALARELVRPESRWHWWTPTVVSLLVLVIGLRFA